jgi:arginyl-tRNA synthetase
MPVNGGALDFAKLGIEPPRDASHGDIATNAALVLAKQAGMAPRELGEKLAAKLSEDGDVAEAGIAGPGFVNLKLADGFWRKQLATVLEQETRYGRSNLGGGMKINVEYVSANPTGPMHVGHCRGAVVGDALANLLALPATT